MRDQLGLSTTSSTPKIVLLTLIAVGLCWGVESVVSLHAPALIPVVHADDEPGERAKMQVAFGIDVARRGLWEEAIHRWVQAAELDPDNSSAQNNLAVAYEQSGKFELANESYERALELSSDNIYIRQNYELFREAYERKKRKEKDGANP